RLPVDIPAVDDACLVGVKLQPTLTKTFGDFAQRQLRLGLALAVHHTVIGVATKPHTAQMLIYPLHGTDCCTAVKSGLSRLRDGPMLYRLHEMQRTLLAPWVYGAEAAA